MPQLFFYLSISLILTFIPLPAMLAFCWPNWVVLFFFWINHFKPQTPIYFWIWSLGLLLDLLQATNLGVHVIALTMMNFILTNHRSKFLVYPLVQQMLIIFFATNVYLFFSQFFCVDMPIWRFMLYMFQVSIATTLVWPWIENTSKSKLFTVHKKMSL